MKLPAFGKIRNHVQVIHVACMGSLVALGATCWALYGKVDSKDFPVTGPLLVIGAFLSVSAVGIAAILPKFSPGRRPDAPLPMRVSSVYLMHVMSAALIETAGLYWGALVMILGQPAYLVGPMLALVVLGAWFPTQSRIEEQLGMTEVQYDAALERANETSP